MQSEQKLRISRDARIGLGRVGVATADALYAAGAGFAMAALSAFTIEHRTPLQLIGGLVLIGLGLRSRGTRSERRPAAVRSGGHAGPRGVPRLGRMVADAELRRCLAAHARLSTTWTSSVGRLNGLLLVALGGVALLQLPDPERAFCPRTFAVSLDQPAVPA